MQVESPSAYSLFVSAYPRMCPSSNEVLTLLQSRYGAVHSFIEVRDIREIYRDVEESARI